MALVPVNTRNRVNPLAVSTIEQLSTSYGHPELCRDPYCSICRGQKSDRHHKHHHKRHGHHHRKHKTHFWDDFFSRGGSASSTVAIHNIELDERRSYYSPRVTERTLLPVNRTEQQIVSTTRTRPFADDEIVREPWTNYPSNDDEVVCCRAYNGCRCPCWCCIILIILTVILLIVLIVLLATLL